MRAAFDLVLQYHIFFGFVAIAAFWAPLLVKKGGLIHRGAGLLYVAAMLGVLATASIMAGQLIAAPLEIRALESEVATEIRRYLSDQVRVIGVFFAVLVLVTFTAGWRGLAAVRRRRGWTGADRVGTVLTIANLLVAGPALYLGVTFTQPLLVMFAVIAFLGSGPLLLRRKAADDSALLAAHFGGMITTGIAAHTAFLSFGVLRFIPDFYSLSPALHMIPWIVPAIIGAIAIAVLRRRYKSI